MNQNMDMKTITVLTEKEKILTSFLYHRKNWYLYSKHESSQIQNNSAIQKYNYVCPMNCESDKEYKKPGNCPICDMALMPRELGHLFY